MNIKRIKEIVFHKLGIDGAILYTTSARIIQAEGGILTQFVAHEMAHIRIKNLRCRSIFIYLQPKYYSSWLHTIH
jgi:polysaccharide biosynthesis protein